MNESDAWFFLQSLRVENDDAMLEQSPSHLYSQARRKPSHVDNN